MKLKSILISGLAAITFSGCTTNPITGRSSLQIANNNELVTTSLQEYSKVLSTSKIITNSADATKVKNVGNRIKAAAERYYQSRGLSSALANYKWEFNLLEDKQVNAWCMPGGKVAVYSAIMPITQTENGLAVVLGHEISHALAGHGNERISQAMIAQYGGQLAGAAISNNQLRSIFSQAYPLGAQVGLLAYGRKQESEADEMGLYLMAMAGYDPREALPFWHRMEATSKGSSTPAFLSTHPSPENRRADIDAHMPKALEYYRAAGGKL